ncbi:MAG: Na+/H+ antiporter NhaC family protein [Bacteroidia bacterium]
MTTKLENLLRAALLTFLLAILPATIFSAPYHSFSAELPTRIVGKANVEGSIVLLNADGAVAEAISDTLHFQVNGTETAVAVVNGKGNFSVTVAESRTITIQDREGHSVELQVTSLPFWLSILPPLIAILLALIFREVITALFLGVLSGLLILNGFDFSGLMLSLLRFADTYLINAISDPGHLSVIVFSLLIGGMVSLVSANGGMTGIVKLLTRYANSSRRSQLVTWFLGILIFFDDYANTLIVGNTMRPLTDRYKVSREKLAYIVDSTAAPVAAIAFITTWIGAELGYIKEVADALNLQESPYSIFLNSLKYAFYPVCALFFMLMLILMGRDFGPMLKAERKARTGKDEKLDATGQLQSPADEGRPEMRAAWLNAFLPVFSLVAVAFGALLYTGYSESVWSDPGLGFLTKIALTLGEADAYQALLWASFLSLLLAIVITLARRVISLQKTVEVITEGIKSMFMAIMILILAWVLAALTWELNTAQFIASAFSGNVNPLLLPFIVFLISAIVSFSTGSSWGTMAILYPLLLPVSYQLSREAGFSEDQTMELFYEITSVILAGSVFGDHCSPISDTTILSSLSTSCSHISHVQTQLPYAVTVALTVMATGHLVSVFIHIPWWLSYLIAFALLFLTARFAGKQVVPLRS